MSEEERGRIMQVMISYARGQTSYMEALRHVDTAIALAVEEEREEIAWLENAVLSGHFHHKKWEPRCYYCVAALRAPGEKA